MNTKIQKWGNSLAVRLPKNILENQGFQEGGAVHIKADGKRIIITPAVEEATNVNLSSLVEGITTRNRHVENSWGDIEGNEVW